MVVRQRDGDRFGADRTSDEILGQGWPGYRCIEARLANTGDEAGDREVLGAQAQIRAPFGELTHDRRHDLVGQRRQEADPQRGSLSADAAGHDVHGAVGAAQDGLGLTQENLSDRGQGHAATGSLQQLGANLGLETPDLL